MTSMHQHLTGLVGKEIEVLLDGRSVAGILHSVDASWFITLKPTVKWLDSIIVDIASINAVKVYAPRDTSKDDDDDSNQCEDSGVR